MQEDIVGQRFGRWIVSALSNQSKYGKPACECICDCGTKRLVAIYRLGTQTFSCGCARNEAAAAKNRKHGLEKHRLRTSWRSMRERCMNPNHEAYFRYGGRGIKVCERWDSIANFVEDMDATYFKDATLDRYPNQDGDYEPNNVRWATRLQQANNRSPCRYVEFRGRTQTVAEWARELGMFEHTLRKRLDDSKWSVEKALTTPVRERAGSPHKPKMLPRDLSPLREQS